MIEREGRKVKSDVMPAWMTKKLPARLSAQGSTPAKLGILLVFATRSSACVNSARWTHSGDGVSRADISPGLLLLQWHEATDECRATSRSSLSPSHPTSSVSFCLLLRTRFGRSHNSEEETGRCEICPAVSYLSSKTHFLSPCRKPHLRFLPSNHTHQPHHISTSTPTPLLSVFGL
jgi:hypothetical protein